jgi:hypothetical protein
MTQPGQGWYPVPRRTNTLSIVAVALLLVLPPVAAVLGLIAWFQLEDRNEDGAGFAIGAMVGGVVVTLAIVAYVLFVVWATSRGA